MTSPLNSYLVVEAGMSGHCILYKGKAELDRIRRGLAALGVLHVDEIEKYPDVFKHVSPL